MRVWDYAAETYVHRLVSTEDGGAMVATSHGKGMTAMAWADEDDEMERATLASKADFVAQFYSRLLHQQLELQAQYYLALIDKSQRASSGADVAKSETVARNKIVAVCVSGYRQLTAGLRVAVLGESRGLNERMRRVQGQLELLAATTASVLESIQKVKALTAAAGPKRLSAIEAKRKQIAQLTEEVEALFASFST